jgi:hypothetical protein
MPFSTLSLNISLLYHSIISLNQPYILSNNILRNMISTVKSFYQIIRFFLVVNLNSVSSKLDESLQKGIKQNKQTQVVTLYFLCKNE